ncbi:MAG: nuclear transport factor 2 family protein [Myxococcaceae bacterium]|nr:nuclear transport factor 2 family protein [Myxococcaceae bacterium]
MTRQWLLLLLLALGCPKPPPPKPAPPPPPPDPMVEVRELVKFAYSTLETGDPDPLKPKVAPDVMAFGLGPSDTFSGRDPAINFVRQELLSISLESEVLRIRSGRIDVGLAQGEQSAWFWDLPRVEYERKGKTTTWLARVTGHAVKQDGAWQLDAVHVSLGVPDEKVFAPDAARKYLPPADVLAERGKDSDELVGLARRLLDDMAVKVERSSDRAEYVIIGTSTELFEGGKSFKDLVRPQLAAIKKAGFSFKTEGPLRSRLAPERGSGWVAANIVMRIGTGKKQQVLPPFRVLWVFAEEKGLWNLVSEHQSLALKQDLRTPADEAAIKAFELVDKGRRARSDPKAPRASVPDAGEPSTAAGRGGRVTEAADGGLSTFD